MSLAGATARLAGCATAVRFDDLSAEVLEAAELGVLDWVGVAIAGAGEPVAVALADVLGGGWAAAAGGGASLLGRALRAGPLDAALVNGAAAHALDYDDSLDAMEGHASTPILPALLALAESRDLPPQRFLAAYVAGIDCAWLLGTMVNPEHYELGWHATATLGVFAAAAACANLLGFDQETTRRCLGLAGVQASGLKRAFGTMAKPFQVARATQAGLLSALLCERGLTAPGDVIEAAQGFASTYGVDPRPRADPLPAGDHAVTRLLFKYHAACHATHPAIEAIARLRAGGGLTVERIRWVDVDVVPSLHRICGVDRPATGLEAKFTLPGVVAMALLDLPTADPAAYSDRLVARSDYRQLVERVRIHPTEGFGEWRSRVRIQTVEGELTAEADIHDPPPSPGARRELVTGKFRRLTTPLLGQPQAERLAAAISRLHRLPSVPDWVSLCAPPQ